MKLRRLLVALVACPSLCFAQVSPSRLQESLTVPMAVTTGPQTFSTAAPVVVTVAPIYPTPTLRVTLPPTPAPPTATVLPEPTSTAVVDPIGYISIGGISCPVTVIQSFSPSTDPEFPDAITATLRYKCNLNLGEQKNCPDDAIEGPRKLYAIKKDPKLGLDEIKQALYKKALEDEDEKAKCPAYLKDATCSGVFDIVVEGKTYKAYIAEGNGSCLFSGWDDRESGAGLIRHHINKKGEVVDKNDPDARQMQEINDEYVSVISRSCKFKDCVECEKSTDKEL